MDNTEYTEQYCRISEKNCNNFFAALSFMYFTNFRQMSHIITSIST